MYNIVNQLGVESIYTFVKPGSKHIQPLTEELDIGVFILSSQSPTPKSTCSQCLDFS